MNTPSDKTERRHYERVPFIAEVIMSDGTSEWTSALLDISLKGVLLEPPSDIEPEFDKTYDIELILGEETEIKMRGKISHAKGAHWGLEWENIDLESLSHLRRLLELNMNDPDEINRELSDLG